MQNTFCIFTNQIFPSDFRPRNAIEVARRFANGEATGEELLKVAVDAVDATGVKLMLLLMLLGLLGLLGRLLGLLLLGDAC